MPAQGVHSRRTSVESMEVLFGWSCGSAGALVVADGDVPRRAVLDAAWPGWADEVGLIVAADGGWDKAAAIGLVPDLLVGDADSLAEERFAELAAAGVPIERSPVAKDESDTELAILAALRRGATHVTVLGALGGKRFDHALANVGLLGLTDPGDGGGRAAGRLHPRPAAPRSGGRRRPGDSEPVRGDRRSGLAPAARRARPRHHDRRPDLPAPRRDAAARSRPRPVERSDCRRRERDASPGQPAGNRNASQPHRRSHKVSTAVAARGASESSRWRTVDIVVVAILAVAFGVVFYAWNAYVWVWLKPLGEPWEYVISGMWLMPAVVAPLIVRKPGAALFAELVAAIVSVLLGSQWGLDILLSGSVQGAGAELVFGFVMYRNFGVVVAFMAGAGAGIGEALHDIPVYFATYSANLQIGIAALEILSGAAIAGVGGWLLVRSLRRTGALQAFPSRE